MLQKVKKNFVYICKKKTDVDIKKSVESKNRAR